jgi:signal transduction histidine kinase
MVHRIVQQHGGMVEASSRPGRGTRMSVHLPVPGLLESEDVSEEAK